MPAPWSERNRRLLGAYLRAVAASAPLQRELARRYGVSLADLFALRTLRAMGECPVSRLGSAMSLARSTTTDLVDRLECAGLVMRQADPGDRRVTIVRPTPRADEVFGDSELFRESEIALRLRSLPAADQDRLAELLEGLLGLPPADDDADSNASESRPLVGAAR